MLLIKTENIEHASLPFNENDSITVTMLRDKFDRYYVAKENSTTLV